MTPPGCETINGNVHYNPHTKEVLYGVNPQNTHTLNSINVGTLVPLVIAAVWEAIRCDMAREGHNRALWNAIIAENGVPMWSFRGSPVDKYKACIIRSNGVGPIVFDQNDAELDWDEVAATVNARAHDRRLAWEIVAQWALRHMPEAWTYIDLCGDEWQQAGGTCDSFSAFTRHPNPSGRVWFLRREVR